jgi:hypothetical protein
VITNWILKIVTGGERVIINCILKSVTGGTGCDNKLDIDECYREDRL